MTDRGPSIASTGGPSSVLLPWLEKFLAGGPAPVEPDLLATQMGEQPEGLLTRRPNVLPLTVDAQTGQLTWAMPRLFDVLGQTQLGTVRGTGVAKAPPPIQSLSRPELLPDAVRSSGQVPEMIEAWGDVFPRKTVEKILKGLPEWYKGDLAVAQKYWPELLSEGYGQAKPALPKSDSLEDLSVPRKARRMLYPDEVVGPQPPERVLEGDPLQRSVEQGYLSKDLYSGVPTWGEEPPIAFRDPQTSGKGFEQAIFLTDKPSVADRYAKTYGTVMPLRARMKNPLDVEWRQHAATKSYNEDAMQGLIDKALQEGYDSLILRNIYDMGGMQDQYLVLNPNQLRSKFARFDPQNIDANNLLASLTMMLGGAAAIMPPEAQK